MRIGLHVLCFVALASVVSAQPSAPPFPDAVLVNGGWVPCSHQIAIDAGKGCGSTTPTPTANACDPWPSPYAERERLLACLATRREPDGDTGDAAPVSVYQVGQRYHDGYPSRIMIVLAVALGVDGTPHVLAQWLTSNGNGNAGDTFTFQANEHHPWMRYRGGEQ